MTDGIELMLDDMFMRLSWRIHRRLDDYFGERDRRSPPPFRAGSRRYGFYADTDRQNIWYRTRVQRRLMGRQKREQR